MQVLRHFSIEKKTMAHSEFWDVVELKQVFLQYITIVRVMGLRRAVDLAVAVLELLSQVDIKVR